ncbi:MAG: hypothetical protein AAB709_00520 [Patescibacteria group bacterium]
METELLVKIGIVAAFIMLLFILNNVRTSRARLYVLKRRSAIKARMETARLLAKERTMMGIAKPEFLVKLEDEFERGINRLNRFTGADWITERKNIDSFDERLAKAILALMAEKK